MPRVRMATCTYGHVYVWSRDHLVGRYHGGMDDVDREAEHHKWETGAVQLMVANLAFGMVRLRGVGREL